MRKLLVGDDQYVDPSSDDSSQIGNGTKGSDENPHQTPAQLPETSNSNQSNYPIAADSVNKTNPEVAPPRSTRRNSTIGVQLEEDLPPPPQKGTFNFNHLKSFII